SAAQAVMANRANRSQPSLTSRYGKAPSLGTQISNQLCVACGAEKGAIMADDDKSTSALGRFQSRQAGGEQAGAEKQRRVELPTFDPKDLTKVPGIVGRLTDWITAASLYPNKRLALGTSLVTVGTLMSQRVAGPTHGSTHFYAVLLADSASGKQQL